MTTNYAETTTVHADLTADTAGPSRVLLVDDHDIVRLGFRRALEEDRGIQVVGEAHAGPQAVVLAGRLRPDVVLADTHVSADGSVSLLHRLRDALYGTPTRIAVLTDTADDGQLFRALRAGVSGFLLKNVSQPELVQSVRSIAAGHAVISPLLTRRMLDRFQMILPSEDAYSYVLDALSEREISVLRHIGDGLSNQEIAATMHISRATVKSHVSRLLAKLGQPNRIHAALLAHRIGLVDTEAPSLATTRPPALPGPRMPRR